MTTRRGFLGSLAAFSAALGITKAIPPAPAVVATPALAPPPDYIIDVTDLVPMYMPTRTPFTLPDLIDDGTLGSVGLFSTRPGRRR